MPCTAMPPTDRPSTTGVLAHVVVLAGRAEPQLGNRLQPAERDVRVAGLAAAVRTGVDAQEGDLDVVERDPRGGGDLFGHLAQRVETTRPAQVDELAIATFNVENLSAVSPQEKITELARTITTNLSSPDLIVVEEIPDNDGPTDSGVTAADRTWRTLTDGITAVGGPATTTARSTHSTTPTAVSAAATSGSGFCSAPTSA